MAVKIKVTLYKTQLLKFFLAPFDMGMKNNIHFEKACMFLNTNMTWFKTWMSSQFRQLAWIRNTEAAEKVSSIKFT